MKYISALSLAPVFLASADALLHLGIDFELPLGISLPINVDVGPTSSPPEGCTSTWHPPHHGVDMDGCDNDDDDHWHYVHPGQPSYPSQPPHVWTTKTVTATHVSTVLSCAPEVTDCPYRHPTVTTVVVPETTTICPVAVTTGYEAPPTSEAYLPPPVATSTSEGYLPPAETTWTATTTPYEEVTGTTTPCEETVTPTTTPCEETETETYVESTPCEETVTPTTTPCEETETYVVESTPCEETVVTPTTPCEESQTWVTKVSESTPCETPVWTTPMATPVYPPPAGYTTTPAAGSPGYCPGPGCPSPTNAVGTVTHPAYATPTASVVQVTGAAAQNGHTVGGFVAVAAALLAALL